MMDILLSLPIWGEDISRYPRSHNANAQDCYLSLVFNIVTDPHYVEIINEEAH